MDRVEFTNNIKSYNHVDMIISNFRELSTIYDIASKYNGIEIYQDQTTQQYIIFKIMCFSQSDAASMHNELSSTTSLIVYGKQTTCEYALTDNTVWVRIFK